MNINLLKEGDVLTIALEGRLDTNTSPALEEAINNMDNDVRELVLDIKGLEYISSAGLRVILSAQKKMNKVGSMKVVNVCDSIMEIFEITGFVDILVIE